MLRHGNATRRLIGCAAVLALAILGAAAPAFARPIVWMFPPPFENGQNLRELFTDPSAWATTRTRIDGLGYADHWLDSQYTDAELRAWLPQIARWHLKLGLEVGALKPWGRTADQAFAHDRKKWDRFIADGGRIDSIAMDEPLSFTRKVQQPMDFAAAQTARFIALVRQNYPAAAIGDIEPYPGIPASELLPFIDEVQAILRQQNIRGMDFFRLDLDWMHFRPRDPKGQEGWPGVRNMEMQCHRRGLPFSLIYWGANVPSMQRNGTATEQSWEAGIMHEGAEYAGVGGAPDQMVIESWVNAPNDAVPESAPGTLTRSVLDFTAQFAPGYGTGR